MILRIEKGRASGRICAPASKSMAHRLLICASMCLGESRIEDLPSCEDVLATIDCLRSFGVKIEYYGNSATVYGIDFTKSVPSGELDCRESGSTLRFLIPFAFLIGREVRFTGSERLMARPQNIYETLAKEEGLTFRRKKNSITVCGPIRVGEFFIDGNVSSQFISGLLFAFSTMDGDTKIIFNTPIESRPYVDMTIEAMRTFGVRIYNDTDWSFYIFSGQEYKSRALTVEGDWSGAAFIEAFNHLGGEVIIDGLKDDSLQGDRMCKEYFSLLDSGAPEIDISNCPDLGPILFTMAAIKNGATFTGTRRLRDKESDRVMTMKSELQKFGAELEVGENTVRVINRELHPPTERLYGHNDHRIVMSLSVLSTLYGGEIEGCEAVSKSYPDFFKDIKALGIKVYETD